MNKHISKGCIYLFPRRHKSDASNLESVQPHYTNCLINWLADLTIHKYFSVLQVFPIIWNGLGEKWMKGRVERDNVEITSGRQ